MPLPLRSTGTCLVLLASVLTTGAGPRLAAAEADQVALPRETAEQRDARMKWWREARFGMFIHWGLYAIPAGSWKGQPIGGIGEWIMDRANIPVADYEKLAPRFNPVQYDPAQWARVARDAGIKYRDIDTTRTSLEEIFVTLVRSDR